MAPWAFSLFDNFTSVIISRGFPILILAHPQTVNFQQFLLETKRMCLTANHIPHFIFILSFNGVLFIIVSLDIKKKLIFKF